jgi:hypothetical protein
MNSFFRWRFILDTSELKDITKIHSPFSSPSPGIVRVLILLMSNDAMSLCFVVNLYKKSAMILSKFWANNTVGKNIKSITDKHLKYFIVYLLCIKYYSSLFNSATAAFCWLACTALKLHVIVTAAKSSTAHSSFASPVASPPQRPYLFLCVPRPFPAAPQAPPPNPQPAFPVASSAPLPAQTASTPQLRRKIPC